MKNPLTLLRLSRAAIALLALAASYTAATDLSTIPLNTYSATSSTDVKPNLMFILDDSGSMDSDYMPDNTNSNDPTQFRNANYNGLAYNPGSLYLPPTIVSSSTGALDTTTYPNMDGTTTARGADSATKPNWNAVKKDAYGIQSTSTSSLTPTTSSSPYNSPIPSAPYFFTTIPGEYCTNTGLRNCTAADSPTGTYTVPAYLRWCDSAFLTNCQASYDSAAGFTYARQPSPRTAQIVISGASGTSASVTGITVDGKQIMAGTVASTTSTSNLASNISTQINYCTFSAVGNCTTVGYTATVSGSTVTVTAPNASSATPVIAMTGNMTVSPSAFVRGTVPGESIRTTIVPTIPAVGSTATATAYPYPGKSTPATIRNCASSGCSYSQEMTNYANWYTYYRTRMQMMKTSASNAFASLDSTTDMAAGKSRFRIGYMTINNNQTSAFLNLDEFAGNQKFTWYSKLLAAKPNNSTPTRKALGDAGRLFAGKLNGSNYNDVPVTDPLQYYCQRNYALLSTDGFWNSGAGYKMNGSTLVGNQDAGDPAPYGDGGSSQQYQQTSSLQYGTVPVQYPTKTSYLQSWPITVLTLPIQRSDSSNSGGSYGPWYDVASCTVDNSGTTRNKCQYPKSTSSDAGATWTTPAYATSCTAGSSGSTITVCAPGTYNGPKTNVSSCTTSSTLGCGYTAWPNSYTNSGTVCTAVAQSTASPYTVGVATQCGTPIYGTPSAWINVASGSTCTVTSLNSCRYTAWTTAITVSSCTAVPQDAGPVYSTTTAVQCSSTTTGGTSDTLADVAAYYYKTDLRSPNSSDGTGTCVGPVISPSTTANDLCANNLVPSDSDPAQYQHMTTFTLGLGAQGKMVYAPQSGNNYWADTSGDFYDVKNRTLASPSTGICSWLSSGTPCTWPTPSSDSNANIDDLWHAAVNGHGTYFSAKDPATLDSSLKGALSTIANQIISGTAAAAASSNPNVSTSDNFVFSSSYESFLWYGELVRQQIDPKTGSLSNKNWYAQRLLDCASRTWQAGSVYAQYSAFRYVSGSDSRCYWVSAASGYTAPATFDASNTSISVVNEDEAAATKTPLTTVLTGRTIYTKGASGLINFDYTTLTTAGLVGTFTQNYLSNGNSTTAPRLSQFCASGVLCLNSTDQSAASGANLVNYLRGDPTYEGTYYRKRIHVLGDIVSSEAAYVKTPLVNYLDTGYSAYKSSMASRLGVVYVGANDGMLHAFDAKSGQEKWAYVPSMVLPNMYQLADNNYSSNHQYFVDATPEIGDICAPTGSAASCASGGTWKTILVGGLNRGGKGYYALDVTDPANPISLWEITTSTTGFSNLGYTFGNPQIVKTADGVWVVLLTSGYNGADGRGHLYVVNANTGALIRTIDTGANGDLARIVAYVENGSTDNTAVAAYGGDTQGNLWRFDINNTIGANGYDAQLLVSFKDSSNKAQPITAKPTVASVADSTGAMLPVVYVGTGRFLGISDIADTSQQSFYAVVDRSGVTAFGNPRTTGSNFVNQTLTAGLCPKDAPPSVCTSGQNVMTSSTNTVNWSTQNGWYIDFVNVGERSFTDPSIGLGTLLFTTVAPYVASSDPCAKPGNAESYIYALNYLNGSAISNTGNVAGVDMGAGAATRPVMIELADGTVRSLTRISNGTDNTDPIVRNVSTNNPAYGLRRVSWRELTTQ